MGLSTNTGTESAAGTSKNISGGAFSLKDYGGGVWALHFDLPNSKVNKLDPKTIGELNGHLDSLKSRKDIKALLVTSGKEVFIAGADIEVIKTMKTSAEAMAMAADGQAVLQKFENLPFPVIAAVNGACMGGGTELALCCKYIITSDSPSTRIALPEVNLGVLPGFGGTVRLPERIGMQVALDYLLTGKPVDGTKAVKIGLSDAVFPFQGFLDHAAGFAKAVAAGKNVSKKRAPTFVQSVTKGLLEKNPVGRMVLLGQARKMVMSKSKGHYPAPLKILDTLAVQCGKTRTNALKAESKAFGELAITDVSKRLIDLFFATEKLKKMTGVQGYTLDAKDKVKSIGLLGAGVMGGGIAQVAANKLIPVRMKDINYKGLALGTAASKKIFDGLVKRRKLTKREAAMRLALISPTTEYSGLQNVDLVIEAVLEDMNVKKKVLQETEAALSEDAVFATNTSSLSVTELATAAKRPQNVAGMHFFNPVHKMPLIEVIRGDKTSDRAVAMVYELCKRLGKTPIVVKDGPGFLVNRLLMPYLNEGTYLFGEGAPIDEVDRVATKFGLPMGPATLLDEIGLDTAAKVAKILYKSFGDRAVPSPVNDKLTEAKLLGKKSAKGFYLYDAQGKRGELNPDIYKILGVGRPGTVKTPKEDWIGRMLYPMINEAALCLKEGIVTDALDVDLGMIMGTGFPPFRGGPLRYADSVGIATIVKKLEEFAQKVGPRFAPSGPLVEMARAGRTFYND